MPYRVLKELPQGQQPGDVVEFHDAVAAVFLRVGAIERVVAAEPEPSDKVTPRGRYRRSDLRVQHDQALEAS